jgi:peptidoglycan/LPS O-acetylase OafA/YrhL
VFRLAREHSANESERHPASFQRLVWVSFVFALVVASWSCYFQYITHGLAPDFHLRRLLLTGFWILCGLAFYLGGRQRRHGPMTVGGVVLTALALLKAVFYDTVHLSGFERILVLALIGGLLTAASLYLRKRSPGPAREKPKLDLPVFSPEGDV